MFLEQRTHDVKLHKDAARDFSIGALVLTSAQPCAAHSSLHGKMFGESTWHVLATQPAITIFCDARSDVQERINSLLEPHTSATASRSSMLKGNARKTATKMKLDEVSPNTMDLIK